MSSNDVWQQIGVNSDSLNTVFVRLGSVRPYKPFAEPANLVRMILAFTIAFMAIVRIGLPCGLSLEASVILPLLVAAAGIVWTYRRLPLAADTSTV